MGETPSQAAGLDAVILVPFQPYTGYAIEPWFRSSFGCDFYPPIFRGYSAFARFVGRDFKQVGDHRALFGAEGAPLELAVHRSLTAVVLATCMERSGLSWKVLDPGPQEISDWKRDLEALRPRQPRWVGISTTFVVSGQWIRALCLVVRQVLPEARIVLGGGYYLNDLAGFLEMDADVYCLGEGESRLPGIVRAGGDGGGDLESIPGLCLRRGDGSLTWTGAPPSVPLDRQPVPDWSLAERIDPPRSLDEDFLEIGLETQRGCVFRCQFCTYRTYTRPDPGSPEAAAEQILATAKVHKGLIRLTDATATYPPKRWQTLLTHLVAQGGSPHPIWAFARVSDLDDEVAALMAKAGVCTVFIGQESGDQGVLERMRKGTSVEQVRPAVTALQRHGLWAFMGFIHGFPGETTESIHNTRALIQSLNAGFPLDRPAVAWYNAYPFLAQDFSAVISERHRRGLGHQYLAPSIDGDSSSKRITEETLATMMAASRVPHAPVFAHTLTLLTAVAGAAVEPEASLAADPRRYEMQRWFKAVERGTVIFMERDLEGKSPDLTELRRLREEVLERYPAPPGFSERLSTRVGHRIAPFLGGVLQREWAGEEKGGVGLLTRLGLTRLAYRDLGGLRPALRALRRGCYLPKDGALARRRQEGQRTAALLLDDLLQEDGRGRWRTAASG